ncbi:hypothetical protein BH10ACI2_BH10ACI2_19330 [soil metagenome]
MCLLTVPKAGLLGLYVCLHSKLLTRVNHPDLQLRIRWCYIFFLRVMKFQKGLLTEKKIDDISIRLDPAVVTKIARENVERPAESSPRVPKPPEVVEKNRLFETIQEEKTFGRRYLKVFGMIVVLVIGIGVGAYYLMAPGIGDRITTPKDMEAAVREHFLTKEKRTATDLEVYKCEGFYWSRVGVETRNDIANPVFRIATYATRAVPNGSEWNISAVPISSPDLDIPCK